MRKWKAWLSSEVACALSARGAGERRLAGGGELAERREVLRPEVRQRQRRQLALDQAPGAGEVVEPRRA